MKMKTKVRRIQAVKDSQQPTGKREQVVTMIAIQFKREKSVARICYMKHSGAVQVLPEILQVHIG